MSLVTIIIPVYNAEKYLELTLKSVLGQTYTKIEVILVDDASEDNSKEICQKYAKLDDRIVLINHDQNRGQSVSRNNALDIAKGDYICFVDSDDLLEKDAIEKLLFEIQKRNVEILGFNAKIISEESVDTYAKFQYDEEVISGEEYLIRMMTSEQMYDVVWMYFYKKSVIDLNKIRFIEGRIFEDEVWVPEIFLHTKKASYYNYAAYQYYVRNSSTMTRTDIYLKKYDDAEANCKHLIEMSHLFLNSNNREIFCDYIVRMYMESVKYLLMNGKEVFRSIDYSFIRNNIYLRKTKLKYFIFRISKRFYLRLKGISI